MNQSPSRARTREGCQSCKKFKLDLMRLTPEQREELRQLLAMMARGSKAEIEQHPVSAADQGDDRAAK